MGLAVLHVVEEQELKLDPVTVHSHNLVVKPAEDQPWRVRVATQTHVQQRDKEEVWTLNPLDVRGQRHSRRPDISILLLFNIQV